jgi:hypothetical protein
MQDLFSQKINQYEGLRAEIYNCARQIKLFAAISEAKEKFNALKHEDFFGWFQKVSLVRSITVDSFKIGNDAGKYVNSVIKDMLSPQQYKLLLKNSGLGIRLNKLQAITKKLKNYRNKKCAHIENIEIQHSKIKLRIASK